MKNALSKTALCLSVLALAAIRGNAQTVNFYQGRPAYPATGTIAMSVADFNGDGVPDAIVASQFAVSVYPGNANGTFGSPITTALNVTCVSSLVIADFDHDGRKDFACLLQNSFQVGIGNGDGTFQPPKIISYSGLSVLSTGDFNGDGVPDLVSFTNSNIVVFLNNGHAAFKAVLTPTTSGVYSSIHPADMNGDGMDDLVATRTTTVAVLTSKGKGTFSVPAITTLNVASADSVTTGDVNGDGKMDIVATVNSAAANLPAPHITSMIQQSDGSFVASYFVSPHPVYHAVLADVNGDGALDLVANTTFGGPALTVFAGAGGAFAAPLSYSVPAAFFKVANLRGNNVPDVVLDDGNSIQLVPNIGNGTFRTGPQLQLGSYTTPCLQGDFNKDGQMDMACLQSYTIDITYATGSKSQPLGNVQTIQLIGPAVAFAVGDFNGDGNVDIEAAMADGSLQYIENNGAGGFVQPGSRSPSGPLPTALAAGDFNGDGKLDLITGAGYFLPGNGDGTFQPAVSFYSGSFLYFAVADFNRDGALDAVGIPGGNNTPVALLGTGDGQFHAHPLTGVNGSYNPVVTDLNHDGKWDLVIPAGNFGVTVLLGNGDGTFASAPSIHGQFWPPVISAAVADLNGDGRADITFGIQNYSVYVVNGNGDGSFGPIGTGFGVADSTSITPLSLAGTASAKPTLVVGASVISFLESQ